MKLKNAGDKPKEVKKIDGFLHKTELKVIKDVVKKEVNSSVSNFFEFNTDKFEDAMDRWLVKKGIPQILDAISKHNSSIKDEEDNLLDSKSFDKKFRISPQTRKNWAKKGKVKEIKIGRRVYYDLKSIKDLKLIE